ncbi:uroporphyrinogen-III synthase [Actinoplanes sp. NPDC051859]|uniref:uroporphyrinogen-III synthase n=1 Tax=Actinoplanes sp. NPDC051859 TaxID=3363909 RepID=UPI0037ACBD8A
MASGAATSLSGYTVGVTSDRRRAELADLFTRLGARVICAPALRVVSCADSAELRTATRDCLDTPPDIVWDGSGDGLGGWLSAAESWGVAEPLRAVLMRSCLLTRGDLDDHLDDLLARGVAGLTVAMQLHGESQPEAAEVLRTAGARVIEVPVFRWAPPADQAPLFRLVDLVAARLVDAVTFTSAPAVTALLRAAGPRAATVLEALRGDVLAACVGPVTAAPLRERDVPVVTPARAGSGALVRTVEKALPGRARTIDVAGHRLTLRGHAAIVDGELKPLAPGPMAVLRALAATPGRVLSRAVLLHALPRGADEHAVEMAVARLRAGLGLPGVVQTVVKRGYRLPA